MTRWIHFMGSVIILWGIIMGVDPDSIPMVWRIFIFVGVLMLLPYSLKIIMGDDD